MATHVLENVDRKVAARGSDFVHSSICGLLCLGMMILQSPILSECALMIAKKDWCPPAQKVCHPELIESHQRLMVS